MPYMSLFVNLLHTIKTKMNRQQIIWWIGIPFFVALVDVAPFLYIRCFLHLHSYGACWRLPVVGSVIFDGHVYRQFMGMAALGIGDSYHVGVFGFIIHAIYSFVPYIYNTELWLLLTWVFGVLNWWTAAWMLKSFTSLSRSWRRLAATILWVAILLTLGFRPGIFSWFLPFGFVMLASCAEACKSLQRRRWYAASIWSLVALACSIVYPWFFIFATLWIASVWVSTVSQRLKWKHIVIAWSVLTSVLILGLVKITTLFSERMVIFFETLLRNGAAFTHIPGVTNLLVAAVGWCAVMIMAAYHSSDHQKTRQTDCLLVTGWIITIMGWCSSMATGLYIHNDHFRIFVFIFAWISCAVLIERRLVYPQVSTIGSDRPSRILVMVVAIIASLISIRYVFKPYALDHDQLNAIHLTVWASLAISVWAALLNKRVSFFSAGMFFAIASLGIGLPQYLATFSVEAKLTAQVTSVTPAVMWIRSSVPLTDRLCVSSEYIDVLGASTGYDLFFSEYNVFASGSDEDLYVKLKTYSSIISASTSTIDYVEGKLIGSRGAICNQFPWQRKVFGRWVSPQRLDNILGCQRDVLAGEQKFIHSLLADMNGQGGDDIKKLCPWIILGKSTENIPVVLSSYERKYDDKTFTIFRASP